MAAFFDPTDLADWWQVRASVTVPRPLGTYAIEWRPPTSRTKCSAVSAAPFTARSSTTAPGAFFVADAFWQPPEGDPIGPMALEVQCRPHGNGRPTMSVTVGRAARARAALAALLRDHGAGWERALGAEEYIDREIESGPRRSPSP